MLIEESSLEIRAIVVVRLPQRTQLDAGLELSRRKGLMRVESSKLGFDRQIFVRKSRGSWPIISSTSSRRQTPN